MPEAPAVTYRLLTEADLSAAVYVRKAALESLDQNRERPAWQPNPPVHMRHLLRTDPDCAWMAEVNGVTVGYAMGFVRGSIWFLSQFFVQPEVHAAGAGQGLLERCIQAGRARGATIVSVVATPSPVAHALYMRAGMFAAAVGYAIKGPTDALLGLPAPDASQKRIVDCAGWQDRIAELDKRVWGAERRADHELYMSGALAPEEVRSFGLARGSDFIGYGYADASGWVGPVASDSPEHTLMLLRMAGEWLRERGADEARLFALSANKAVLGALLANGWRIDRWTYFLASERFGQFDRYVPAGGAML